jgi:hypothetical protein
MSAVGQSRRGRLLPVDDRLPQCPESGREVRASAYVAKGQEETFTESKAHSIVVERARLHSPNAGRRSRTPVYSATHRTNAGPCFRSWHQRK